MRWSRRPCATSSGTAWRARFIVEMAERAFLGKGFTLPRYRGQRLHAIGMTRALCHYLAKGRRGIVCYVESTNQFEIRPGTAPDYAGSAIPLTTRAIRRNSDS
jgi:hypothetical protein